MAWGLSMPSNAEHARSRTLAASVVRWLLASLALFVSLPSPSVWAAAPASGGSTSEASTSPPGLAAADGELERSLCDLADVSVVVAPGSCEAPQAEQAVPAVVSQRPLAELAPPAVAPPAADPNAQAAPMCDLSAASIAAAVEIPQADRARFEPLPCDDQRLLSLLRSHDRNHSAQLIGGEGQQPRAPQPASFSADRPDGACAPSSQPAWPERTAISMLPVAVHRGLAWQPGHVSRLDRPPSPRA
jgi:hypothetical protein